MLVISSLHSNYSNYNWATKRTIKIVVSGNTGNRKMRKNITKACSKPASCCHSCHCSVTFCIIWCVQPHWMDSLLGPYLPPSSFPPSLLLSVCLSVLFTLQLNKAISVFWSNQWHGKTIKPNGAQISGGEIALKMKTKNIILRKT